MAIPANQIVVGPPNQKPVVYTRFGYEARDCVKALQDVLSQTGASATGKALHYSADLLCSGGFEIWIRLMWQFVFQHVHLTSLRIFVYLQQRTKDLEDYVKDLDQEEVYRNPEFQQRAAEVVLIIQTLPRNSKIVWPKVPEETHDQIWLHTVPNPKESEAVRKVWSPQSDQPIMRFVGNQILEACEQANVERALFWIRWLFDEEKRVRKENKGYSLSTARRAGGASAKIDKAEIGYYIAAILVEAYKDLARRGAIRMNEEFQALVDLWRGKQSRLSMRQRQESLALMALAIAEVPRWKVPAAQPLIKDPTIMSRAVQQSVRFFQEILVKPRVNSILPKDLSGPKAKKMKKKDGGPTTTEDKMRLMDEMVMAFITR
jgi:hypothetical protein